MNDLLKLGQATLALCGLLFGLASQATDVAELPLKTSVLAKPNVIFAMDDSGSMDWEMVLRTDNGFVWWSPNSDPTRASAWDANNNRPLESSSNANGFSYLFPMGEASDFNGGQLYNNGNTYGKVAPPIAQLAWTRSSALNSMYYNSTATYPAWSPAYVSGAQRTYADAPPAAAPAHPGPFSSGTVRTLNLGADWTSASSGFNEDRFKFWVSKGMVLPVGTQVSADSSSSNACSGARVKTLTAVTTVTGGGCFAAVPYFPATFWQRTVCPAGDTSCTAAPDCVVSDPVTTPTSACVNSPDGVGKLRRYEIKNGNTFPSGRSYADELQNFANWFTYYRKRKLLLAGAMGRALEPANGVRLGVVRFCDGGTEACAAPTMYDADATSNASNRFAAAGQFYLNAMSAQGTPTHYTMSYIGDQFNTNTNIVQYACQRNSLFVVTDGFSNTASITPPAWDAGKSANSWGAAAPYQVTAEGSQADLALRFFTNRLRSAGATPLAAGKLPAGDAARKNPDLNTDLHITTYAITLGARGTLYPAALNPFATDIFATPPAWPAAVADDPTMIDDLWHATINGRGQMYVATDADAMRQSIQAAFGDILGQIGGQSGLAVTSINLQRGDAQAYLGTYTPAGWAGNLTANAVDPATGAVSAASIWSASAVLGAMDWTTRRIATFSGGAGVAFTDGNIGATVNPANAYGTSAAVVDYLRGKRTGEGISFRARTSLLGAVINAEPVPSRDDKLVYLASGEGMLHAVDSETGREHWAFVPGAVLPGLGQISSRSYGFRTKLDATPALGKLAGSGKRILVGALGGAGRSYYALDVSAPRDMTEASLAAAALWQFPAANDAATLANMGYSYGRPVIAKTSSQGDVVLVTSGYDNAQSLGDGKGRMWMLNALTGAIVREFVTPVGAVGAEAGLSHVSAFRETDGTVRHVYGGDLLGNLWHFDLNTGSTVLMATFKDASGNAQPVTAAPELVTMANNRVVLVGTGRLLDVSDFGSGRTQSFYAIADGATLANARSGLIARTYTRGGSPEISGAAVDWATGRGWYFDLPAGEQANTAPTVAYGTIGFTTNVNGGSNCNQSAYMYLVDIGTGLKSDYADFSSAQISATANASRLNTLRIINGQLVGTSHTSDNGVYRRALTNLVPIKSTKNAWKEIRR